MKKSYIKYLVIFFIVVLFLYSLYLALTSKKQVASTGTGTSAPSGPTITVPTQSGGSEKVNDFTKNPQQVLSGTTVLVQNGNYSIVYFSSDQSFLITLLSQPVQENRIVAEQDLLDKLGIQQMDACNLKVSLTIPASVDETLSGQDWGLSFCPNGKSFPAGD